jgi:hypothetical protein
MRSRGTADELKKYCRLGQRKWRWVQEVLYSNEVKWCCSGNQEEQKFRSRGTADEIKRYCRWDQEVLQVSSIGTAAEVERTKMRILLLFMQTTGSTEGVRIWRVYIHRVKSTGFYFTYKGSIISWLQLHEETKWLHEYSTIPAWSKCTSVLIHNVKKDWTICTWFLLYSLHEVNFCSSTGPLSLTVQQAKLREVKLSWVQVHDVICHLSTRLHEARLNKVMAREIIE